MEILHQYLYLIRLIKNEEEGLECGYENIKQIEVPNNIETLNGESIEKLLQTVRLLGQFFKDNVTSRKN
jgi:hypothetical protein